MDSENQFDGIVLQALRSRITIILPTQIIACLEKLSEEEIWWRPNESSNSIGNLILHLSGSLRHYLSRSVGGMDYERNRPAEFSERRAISKAELTAIFNETIAQAKQVFDSFDTARFPEPSAEPAYNPTIFNAIFNVAIHLATHAGQIVFMTKMLEEGAVDELWIRIHKRYSTQHSDTR
jgi:uncharacterized damage-inducible protein DinB